MSRNNAPKYSLATRAILEAVAWSTLDPKSINHIFIKAVNENRIRMLGNISYRDGDREQLSYSVPNRFTGEINAIPRTIFDHGYWVIPAFFKDGVRRVPSLCDEWSNIYVAPVNSGRFSMVIENVHLLNSDTNKILREVLSWPGSAVTAGAKRKAGPWGAVIVHLLDLQDRGALQTFASTGALVKSVEDNCDGIDGPSIRPVLDVVVKLLAQRETRPGRK